MQYAALLMSFHGRIGRKAFWIGFVITALVFVAVDLTVLAMDAALADVASHLIGALAIAPFLAVAAKRIHDLNRSAWWLLLGITPVPLAYVVGWAASIDGRSAPEIEQAVTSVLSLSALALLALAVLVLGLRPGARKYNIFGGPPAA